MLPWKVVDVSVCWLCSFSGTVFNRQVKEPSEQRKRNDKGSRGTIRDGNQRYLFLGSFDDIQLIGQKSILKVHYLYFLCRMKHTTQRLRNSSFFFNFSLLPSASWPCKTANLVRSKWSYPSRFFKWGPTRFNRFNQRSPTHRPTCPRLKRLD